MRHIPFILATSVTPMVIAPVDAEACSVALPTYPLDLELHPRGEVAPTVRVSIERRGGDPSWWRGPLMQLVDSSGVEIPLVDLDCKPTTITSLQAGERCSARPADPLPPGDYLLGVDDEWRNNVRDIETYDTTFTVLDEQTPDAPLLTPTLAWKIVAFTDLADEPFELRDPFGCGPGVDPADPVRTRAWLRLDAAMEPGTPPGHFDFVIERDGLPDVQGSSFTSESDAPEATWVSDRFYNEFQPCVSVRFVDIYGRSSEPTTLCQPEACEVRDKNDRREIDWAEVEGCSDWSPGYVERNSPGGGCAQAPGAPAGSPAALASLLGLLGAWRRRRRARLTATAGTSPGRSPRP